MTSGELCKRLRDAAAMGPDQAGQYQYDHSVAEHICTKAADRIEQLEAALRDIAAASCVNTPYTFNNLTDIARAALKETP